MRAIYPGRPQSKLQALCTGYWDGLRVIAYISGNAVIILKGPQEILQTIYVDDVDTLDAIAIEETSGRIAVCGEEHVYIYGPLGRDERVLKWSQIHDLENDGHDCAPTLSWASSDELLVGGSQFMLWNIPDSKEPSKIWTQKLANPVKLAQFSHDGGLIASCGHYDRLVKVWRRLSYEFDGTRFDVSYLPHPASVTNMHWRKPWHAEQNLDNLLYTFCSDNKIRIWAHSDPHAKSVMQHVADIDMNVSIQPRRLSVGSMSKRRYGFVLDSRDFSKATEKAVENCPGTDIDHALEHLVEIANRSPEICIILDGLGHMSAWGLENAGCKNKKSATLFNVAHVDGMKIFFGNKKKLDEDFAQLCVFAGRLSDSTLTIISHTYDGKIDWYDSQITELFDPSSRDDRARLVSSWTGHDAPVSKITRNSNGSTLLSLTEENEGILWTCSNVHTEPPLRRKALLGLDTDILQSSITADGQFVIILQPKKISLWDMQAAEGKLIADANCSLSDANSCMLLLEEENSPESRPLVAVFDSKGKYQLLRLHLPYEKRDGRTETNGHQPPIERYQITELSEISGLSQILPMQPPICFNESAIAVTSTGVVHVLKYNTSSETAGAAWSVSKTIDTHVDDPLLLQAVGSGKLAVVDSQGTNLTIWDLKYGWLKFQQDFPDTERIKKLAWATTEHHHSMLAVGLQHRIVIFAQLRYSSYNEQDPWAQVREIRMRDFATHSLGDLCWLPDGSLLIGAGNQMFVYELDAKQNETTRAEEIEHPANLLQLVDHLNGSLPIFHPEYIHHLLSQGKLDIVQKVLSTLHHKLKFWSEGDDIPSDLGFHLENLLVSDSGSSDTNRSDENEKEHNIDEEEAAALSENLATTPLSQLSSSDHNRLATLATQVAALQSHNTSIDPNALRYLHLSQTPGKTTAPYSSTLFASRSNSQEILTSLLSTRLTWSTARASGLFTWLSPHSPLALTTAMESIARNEYTASDDRSPVGCSIFYLTLRKKSVLQGLWRMVPGLREQVNTLKLLANNFEEPKWRTTALKNGYALLSKRRFEYGAAFFLLGGSLKDAVNVCVHQLKDIQLGIAIARVYGGDDMDANPILRSLLAERILPDAISRGDRWGATWACGMLGEKTKALQACVRPLHILLDGGSKSRGTVQAMHWRNDDPQLAVLYLQLRNEMFQNRDYKGGDVGGITEKEEWDFVLRCARQYVRLGCDWLALDLVRNWEFLPRMKRVEHMEKEVQEGVGAGADDEKEYAVVEEELTKEEKKAKPPPTQFQEPDASSLLDSFGF